MTVEYITSPLTIHIQKAQMRFCGEGKFSGSVNPVNGYGKSNASRSLYSQRGAYCQRYAASCAQDNGR
jgi:hypothetical protein